MKERPILFSGPMVRALLEGRKTQTRRVVKPIPSKLADRASLCLDNTADAGKPVWHFTEKGIVRNPHVVCPYGQPGDRLWVRETWAAIRVDQDGEVEECPVVPHQNERWGIVFAASDPQATYDRDDRGFSWRPSIHMPRWASRLLLEVTEVRVQRLQDINGFDAIAEGVDVPAISYSVPEDPRVLEYEQAAAARDLFQELWDSINAERGYGWDSNPWVWAISFRRVTP